jgi:hypothetical protein
LSAEQFADGGISEEELNNVRSRACQSAQTAIARGYRRGGLKPSADAFGTRITLAADTALGSSFSHDWITIRFARGVLRWDEQMKAAVPWLLRDIFGNPFRPVPFSPKWATDTAVSLARTMYESRDFSAMPILADAFQDAGCDSEDILNHCRDVNATHVRGCWVVDRVLGKE